VRRERTRQFVADLPGRAGHQNRRPPHG
jgi:hypothetical protein